MKAKIRKFFALSWNHKMLFLEALTFQLVTGLLLKLVPFRMVPKIYGYTSSRKTESIPPRPSSGRAPLLTQEGKSTLDRSFPSSDSQLSPLTSHISRLTSHVSRLTSHTSPLKSQVSSLRSQVSSLTSIRDALLTSSPLSPWRNRCLVQSLAAKWMLNRRRIPSLVSLGMAKDDEGRLRAHAWLSVGDFEVVEKNGDYTELFLF